MPSRTNTSSDIFLFLRKFLRHGTKIASVVPSSPTLSRSMAEGLPLASHQTIVELGAGTGPVTSALVERIAALELEGVRLLPIESDPDFCAVLRQKFPQLEIIEGDACRFAEMMKERGVGQVDHIVGGLPVPSLSPKDRHALMDGVRSLLKPDGMYQQLTELALVYRPLYKHFFHDVRFHFVPFNLPPSGWYECRRPIVSQS
jgi:ornithine lipid N-methyltransferase